MPGYDYLGRLTTRTVDADGDGTAETPETTHYVHDGTEPVPVGVRAEAVGQIVAELDETGLPIKRYLWGAEVDQLLAEETVDPVNRTAAGDVAWPLADHQNTIRDWATQNAQGQTSVAAHVEYDPFGAVDSDSMAAAADHLFAYTARPWDPANGLQNNLNRWYDANTGRWLSEDPIGFEAGDVNLYRYCGNDAVNGVDPSGLIELLEWDGIHTPRVRDYGELIDADGLWLLAHGICRPRNSCTRLDDFDRLLLLARGTWVYEVEWTVDGRSIGTDRYYCVAPEPEVTWAEINEIRTYIVALGYAIAEQEVVWREADERLRNPVFHRSQKDRDTRTKAKYEIRDLHEKALQLHAFLVANPDIADRVFGDGIFGPTYEGVDSRVRWGMFAVGLETLANPHYLTNVKYNLFAQGHAIHSVEGPIEFAVDIATGGALLKNLGRRAVQRAAKGAAVDAAEDIVAKRIAFAAEGIVWALPKGRRNSLVKAAFDDVLESRFFKVALFTHNAITSPLRLVGIDYGWKWVTKEMVRERMADALYGVGKYQVQVLRKSGRLLFGGAENLTLWSRQWFVHELIHVSQIVKNPNLWSKFPLRMGHEWVMPFTAHPYVGWPGLVGGLTWGGWYLPREIPVVWTTVWDAVWETLAAPEEDCDSPLLRETW